MMPDEDEGREEKDPKGITKQVAEQSPGPDSKNRGDTIILRRDGDQS
jgi:hypothetical protein